MRNFLLITFTLLLGLNIQAGPGDTIMIQTFEFEGYPVGSGWLSPRDGTFDFSAVDGLEFNKVFMHYTLKCDPSQSPACGEWDYLSYIKVMEHTGIGYHPSYKVGGEGGFTPSEYPYMNDVSWKYQSRIEETIVYGDPNELTEYEVGNGNAVLNNPFDASLTDSRSYYMFRADELSTAGLSAGEITGLQFNIQDAGDIMNRLNIRLKETTDSELSQDIDQTSFTTVYSKDTEFSSTGWEQVDFSEYFTWDGTSNILVDIYFDGEHGTNGTAVFGDNYSWNCAAISNSTDMFLNFNGPDILTLPVENLSSIDQEISISFWLNGNVEQPQKDAVFEAKNENSERVLNVHLPWNNSRIYWDAGPGNYVDRIEKDSDSVQQIKGTWNHWTFTKEPSIAKMSIFLNGELWHSSTGKFAPIGVIDSLLLGKGIGGRDFYDGKIDDFTIWSTTLDQATIAEWMNKDIDDAHPQYDQLLAYYKFNEEEDYITSDEITGDLVTMRGVPQRMHYRGERFKSFITSQNRPNVKFTRHTSTFTINTEMVVDSFPQGETMVEIYVQENAGETPILDETIFVYPPYYNNYVYDENGIATDSTYVDPDETLVLEMIEYNTSEPGVEILIPWEVGRFITPYGNNLSLDSDGWTWVYDVTDFQHLFHDQVHFKAGNFQELLDMKLYFVEGTPPRDLIDIKSIYSTNTSLNNFDNVIVDTTIDLLSQAKMFSLKTTLTGHGFGSGADCGEFCPNIHSIDVNGNEEYSWQIIQECGENPLYPQGGTWFYDRAGWCPGMPGEQQNFNLTPFINVGTDTQVEVDYDIEHDPDGNYITEIFFVSYDEPNFTHDASIEEIIAPNDFKLNGRYNPICANPIIRIKNTGSSNLTTVLIEYGVEGGPLNNYLWEGNLAFLEEEVVYLPSMDSDDFYGSASTTFKVELSQPNGVNDEYIHNNINTAQFSYAPIHDYQIVIWFKTNNRPWENSYEIRDANENVVFEKDDFEANTQYVDTLNLEPGCYEFIAYDTEGDGMYNWPSNAGNGIVQIKKKDGTVVENLEKWFGEYLRYNFLNTAAPVAVNDIEFSNFKLWPNPSSGKFSLQANSLDGVLNVSVKNLMGNEVYREVLNNRTPHIHQLNLSSLANGIYLVNIESEGLNSYMKIIIEK